MNYSDLLDLLNSYSLALATMGYDAQTIAPKDGAAYRNKAMAILAGEHFKLLTSDEADTALTEASQSNNWITQEGSKYLLKELKKIKDIPHDEYVAFQELVNNAQISWETARDKKDYNLFKDDLHSIIETHKKLIDYRKSNLSVYDESLNDYEEGLRMESVEAFFKVLEDELVPHLDTMIEAQAQRPAFLDAYVSTEKQRLISEIVMEHIGYSKNFGYLTETAHPFSSTFSINDTRITTHYQEHAFTQNIFSVIHEIGHSMYNHQVNPDFEGTPLADNMSMSMHESQSRFLENIIGRSKEFWTPLYPKLQNIIPEVLSDVNLDEFVFGINYIERNPIRIDSDEVTYPLHIMVRYNIEKKILVENASVDTLNTLFAQEMTRLIGITPENDSQGILQDVHWSGASFGYFPTYALGSAYAAQFYEAMKKDIDVEALLLEGNLSEIFKWLHENIHQYSGTIETQELIKKVTGESFNPNYFVDYLKNKYSLLLGIAFD
ncbi:carboxypeptidase M32 [Erysipelothrix sp. HDW6A]|uniref:carboxypeptidase M32 n=1 Tax=Erysipelothrix sp. HDW6A TaxID=2714928 RepID=UPI00140AC260|nr:carboxypeptidase M32 [Erysipelothrix sp. HDW6A]QIK57683.1 carboxypeptidase M32 [Erysipelothrix sp. HDW6A]